MCLLNLVLDHLGLLVAGEEAHLGLWACEGVCWSCSGLGRKKTQTHRHTHKHTQTHRYTQTHTNRHTHTHQPQLAVLGHILSATLTSVAVGSDSQ